MASLQPESDKPLEDQCDNGHLLEDKRKKEELSVSADGLADYAQEVCQDRGEIKERKESGKEPSNSSSRPSYVQPVPEPNIKPDLKLNTGNPKPSTESGSVPSRLPISNNVPGLEPSDPKRTAESDSSPSGAIQLCTKSDSVPSASSGVLKSCPDSDHTRFVQSEHPKPSGDVRSATTLDPVHRVPTRESKPSDESVSIHSKLNQAPKSVTASAPVDQKSASGSTHGKISGDSKPSKESKPVLSQGRKSQLQQGVDSTLTTESFSVDPKPSNESGPVQPACSGDTKPVSKSVDVKAAFVKDLKPSNVSTSAKHTVSKDLKPSTQSDSVTPTASSLKPKDGIQDDDPGLIWSDTEEEFDFKQRDNGPEPFQRKLRDKDISFTIGPKKTQEQEEELTDLSVEMECDGESHEVEEVKDGKTLGEEDGEPVKEVEMKDAGGGEDEDCRQTHAVKKPKKSCLKCHDCGKTFPRREAYDLHRHFHMHQEEQASLTCKECGLTFQHRSSLIKHRSEHKRNGMPEPSSVSPRRSHQRELREEKGYACDSCGELFASLIRYKLHACQVSLEKPYRCPLCRKEFQYRVSINAHMQSHSLDSPYRCLECNKGFQCAVTLHIHQRSHAALKPYECPDCGMVFRHRSLMDDHRRKHTEERPHQCTICCKSFKYSSLLQQHQYLHTGQKPYRCAECGKRFALAQNMRAHCRQHKKRPSSIFGRKSNDMPNGADFKTIGKENTSNDLEQKRNCPLCPQLFYRAADLRAHMLSHEAEYENQQNLGKTSANVYTCSICQLQFPDESALQSHELTHQVQTPPQKREALSVASATSGNNSAEGDWVDQSEKKPLKCKDCGKSFHYRSVLELHMRIHNRGYQCHVCKKSFRFSSYLQQHLIIHSGKKPYKCPDCGKDFAFLQNMKTHQRLHQQKPFRCTQCRKGYSDESQLQRHMLCHSGEKPYKCNLCNKSFGLAYLLRDHLNTHTGERPHRCQECHKSFPWLSSLLVHQKIHARKRQASQSYSSFIGSQRGRPSGLGRGKKSWPRMGESVEDSTALQQTPFSSQILQGTGPKPMEQESSAFDPEQAQSMPLKLQQQWQIQIASQLQQQSKWLSEGQTNKQPWQAGTHLKLILPKPDGLSKLPSHQQSPGWADVSQSAQAGTAPKKLSQDNGDTGLTSQFSPTSPSKAKSDQVQERQQQPLSRLSSTSKSPSKAEGHEDDAESDKPNNNTDKQPQEQQSTGLASSSIRMREEPDSASLNRNNKPLSVVMPLDMSKSSNIQDKPINEKGGQQPPRQIMHPASQQPLQLVLQPSQQIQLLQQAVQQMQPEQLNQMTTLQLLQQQFHQAQSNQLGSVSVQFGATSFTHSNGGTVFGFQPTQVVSQSLLNGPVQPGAQQQAPLVSGSQILLNQASPFISSPLSLASPLALSATHPIHSIAGQLPGAAPQSVFFTPCGIMNERPVGPQTLSSTHVGHRFRCMVCGCTLPGDLELQMHYMKHAQGEI